MSSVIDYRLELRLKLWGLTRTGHPTTDRAGRAVMINNLSVGPGPIRKPKNVENKTQDNGEELKYDF